MKYGLGHNTIQRIQQVFKEFNQVLSVVIYGSRAKGNFKLGSDIDLTFKGQKIDLSIIYKISAALDDLNLPYQFDLSVYDHIDNPDFLDHIKRVGIVFYNANDCGAPPQSEAQRKKQR